MNKTLIIFIMALSMSLMAISSLYALDNGVRKSNMPELLLKYGISPEDRLVPGEKAGLIYSLNINDNVDEQFYPHDKKQDSSDGYMARRDLLFRPYMSNQNVPEPLIYNISIVSYNRDSKSSGYNLEFPSSVSEIVQIGAAFLTNLVMHEFGHEVVANYVGATESRLDFFKKQGDTFFLGTSTVESIDDKSKLPYTMGGEFFADLTFEHALQNYRKAPNTYNKSLLFCSGTDFLWYSLYAFYLSDGHPNYDPITISKETGLSKDVLFSVALAKTMINAYRVYSGQDRIIPYFTVDKYSAALNFAIPFDFDNYIGTFFSSAKKYD